jgi:hypothetical protein
MTSSITLSYRTVRVDVVLANKKFRMKVIYYIVFSRSFRFNLEISVSLMPRNIYGVVVNTLLKLADFVLHHTFVYIIRTKSANSKSRRIGCSILCNILRCR